MTMKTQAFNIALPKDLVEKIDKTAKGEYRNRSELIREAVRVYLKDAQEWEGFFKIGRKQAKKLGIKSASEANEIVARYRHGA